MGDLQGSGVYYDDLPAHFPGIGHRRAGTASPYSGVNGQQKTSGFHQFVIPVDHAAVIICVAHKFN